jgi:uncharacterized protein (TIGR03435 family)
MRRWSNRSVLLLSALVGTSVIGLHGQAAPDPKLPTFEVASIKPLGEANAAALNALGGGCDGGFPSVDHHRFTVATTPYALITWAYGFNTHGGCSFVSYGGLISGGPAWIRSERFAIQALMPEGSPDYTTGQFMNGEAPQLEIMIKTLLADRFHLTVHRETKEVPGYTLVVGKDGPKIRLWTESDSLRSPAQRRDAPPSASRHIYTRTTMTYVALTLGLITRRPVLDKTGLTGEFLFDLEYAPEDAPAGESSAPSIFTAVQEQLGLKLEPAKVPAEVVVIDRAETPMPD